MTQNFRGSVSTLVWAAIVASALTALLVLSDAKLLPEWLQKAHAFIVMPSVLIMGFGMRWVGLHLEITPLWGTVFFIITTFIVALYKWLWDSCHSKALKALLVTGIVALNIAILIWTVSG